MTGKKGRSGRKPRLDLDGMVRAEPAPDIPDDTSTEAAPTRIRRGGKFTDPKVRAQILDKLVAGFTIDAACGAAGVSRAGLYAWLERGKETKDPVVLRFIEAMQVAGDEGEHHIIEMILQDKRNLLAYAQARWPERYNPKRVLVPKRDVGETNGSIRIVFDDSEPELEEVGEDDEIAEETAPSDSG